MPIISGGGSSGGSSSLVQTFSMTAQQIKDSMLTPHTIIAAKGANTLIVPNKYVARLSATVPFSSSASLDLVWGDNDADLNMLIAGLDSTDYVLFTSGARDAIGTFVGYAEGGAAADYLNQPLKFAANMRGSIASVEFGLGGSGYAVGDTGTVNDGSPNAFYLVTSVSAGGVTGVTVTDGGGDYSLAAGRTHTEWETTPGGAQPGSGTGLTVNVTAVDASASAGDGTLSGLIYYDVATLT